MASDPKIIKPRKLTGRMQVELLDAASSRADDDSISPALRRWADGVLEDISVFDLAIICDVEIAQLMDMDIDDLTSLSIECKKANPLFFEMLDREQQRQETMMKQFPDLMQQYAGRFMESRLNGSVSTSPHSAETDTAPAS